MWEVVITLIDGISAESEARGREELMPEGGHLHSLREVNRLVAGPTIPAGTSVAYSEDRKLVACKSQQGIYVQK